MELALRTISGIGDMKSLEESQKFLDRCCWGAFYTGYFTSGCSDYIAANKANFGDYEPCAYAASSERAAGLTPAEIAANDTNAGRLLNPEARAEATRMAQAAIAADIAAHPERYGDLCPTGQVPQMNGQCVPCPKGYSVSEGVCVADNSPLVIIGLLIAGVVFARLI